MADEFALGKVLIIFGLILIIIGATIHYFGNIFSWLGHLPGDIKIEKGNFRFYFPITTMLVISLVLNLVIRLIRIFF